MGAAVILHVAAAFSPQCWEVSLKLTRGPSPGVSRQPAPTANFKIVLAIHV